MPTLTGLNWLTKLRLAFLRIVKPPPPVVDDAIPPSYSTAVQRGEGTLVPAAQEKAVITSEGQEPSGSLSGNASSVPQMRIMAVNDAGQILGYISPRKTRGCCFNIQRRKQAHVFEMPTGELAGKEGVRLKVTNPNEHATEYPFLGIQIWHDEDGSNERWMLRACEEGKAGSIFKGRTCVSPCAMRPGIGEPASSKVWTIQTIEDGTDELFMHWPDDAGALTSLKIVTDKNPKTSNKLWGRPVSYEVTSEEQVVRLVLEHCDGSEATIRTLKVVS
ncbi:hypothetical protein FRB94_010301 [Tulasnella sp. JGI-2019a]|nr:hypothetical protein FRB93_009278 [Tulasnella sp. JGI-2019a]KAG8993894.1 hypothetical protein FRB94_010301 [Tulasnella sp. JGI-2019a]